MEEIVIADCNKRYYEDLEKILIEFKKCCMVCSTGTGKTLMTSKFIKDHDLRTLVIIHQKSIEDVWLTAKVDFDLDLSIATYQSLIRNPKKYRGYDCYVIEEAHHAGAPKWGNAVSKLMNYEKCKNSYFIGLTATPLRYSDGVNVVDSLFDGNSVYGLNRSEAIKLGLVPPADYICTLYNTDDIESYYSNASVSKELMGRLKVSLNNLVKIDEALKLHAPQNPKGIVFVDKINRIEEAKEMIRKSFPESGVYSIHCKMTNQDIYEAIEAFKKSKSAFIVSVNMMNEGFHITGVNTLILLRKTKSPILYLQQTGRGSSDVDKIVIFDFVANNESIQLIDSNMRRIDSSNGEVAKFNNDGKFSDQFIIKNYAKDVLEVLRDIDIKLNGYWTDEEIKFLREYYPENGIKFCVDALGKTECAVKVKASKLGLKNGGYWTDSEEQFLRDHYPKDGAKFCADALSRSEVAIRRKAQTLGLRIIGRYWSDEEIQFLREHYPKDGAKFCADALGKSESAIMGKASYLKLTAIITWSDEEIQFLRDHYLEDGAKFCADALGRSESAVKGRAQTLGLRIIGHYWSDEEIQFLRDHYPKDGAEFCADALGKSKGSVISKANSLGLTIITWSDEDTQFLRDHYPENGAKFCANALGKSEGTIRLKSKSLGLVNHHYWSDEEIQFLRDHYPENGAKFCADALGRSKGTVKAKANSLGLTIIAWPDKDIQFLRDHYSEDGSKFCADALGKSEDTIRSKAKSLGLVNAYRYWSDEDTQFLRDHYSEDGSKFCADALGRSEGTVKAKAKSLGLAIAHRHYWSDEEMQFLRDHYPEDGAEFCANAIGKSVNAVRSKALLLGCRRVILKRALSGK